MDLKQEEIGTNCVVVKHTKISVKIWIKIRVSADIQKVKYRWTDILVGSTTNIYLIG